MAAVLLNGANAFEMGVLCEVFGMDRSEQGLPVQDFALVAAEPQPVRVHPGVTMSTPHGLERLGEADLIALPAGPAYAERDFPDPLLQALRDAVDRGARVLEKI